MNQTDLAIFAALLLALLFQYVPKLKDWYGKQDDNIQRLIMLGALAVAPLVLFAASCGNFTIPGVSVVVACTADGGHDLVQMFITSVVVNQGAFQLLPNPNTK